MATPLPPGWPDQVRPPLSPDWERSAVGWLFDLCPPDYRAHEVLRRHPVVLARLAREHCLTGVEAARRGLATVRADLASVVPPEAVEATVSAYEREGARLAKAAAAVALVEDALAGRRWTPRL
ncbi:MAG: hypothetical protein QOE76_1590 [Frankiales bacterium]|jgi:hypothetical protein|nr:hypothetical protein [Frankiales bacterium]